MGTQGRETRRAEWRSRRKVVCYRGEITSQRASLMSRLCKTPAALCVAGSAGVLLADTAATKRQLVLV